MISKFLIKFRLLIQIVWTALINGYIAGFLSNKLYTGQLKNICVPGLNCYSCPGAVAACPIGTLQTMLVKKENTLPYYIIGFLIFFSVTLGRITCGFLCPFGLLQDLLYKIPFKYKRKSLKFHKYLKNVKYFVLFIFVIALPYLTSIFADKYVPYFCKYICPQGTLSAGLPFINNHIDLLSRVSVLIYVKIAILILVVFLCICVYRPFCKYICPLGAIYALFEKYTIFKLDIDRDKCISCKKCERICKMEVEIFSKTKNQKECIRCGKCIKECPKKAINFTVKK